MPSLSQCSSGVLVNGKNSVFVIRNQAVIFLVQNGIVLLTSNLFTQVSNASNYGKEE